MAESNRILANFTTVSIRPAVIIDGDEYEVAQRDDFGLREYARAQTLKTKVYEKMLAGDELEPEDLVDLNRMLDEFLGLVLIDCPAEVTAKLKDIQKLKIVELFNLELERTTPQATAPNRAAKRQSPTSTSSSRRLRASTDARRTTG